MSVIKQDFGELSGGSGTPIVDSTAQLSSAGWKTGVKLADINHFIVYSDGYSRMAFAENNGGTLNIIRFASSNNDSTVTITSDGYIMFSCTNSTVQSSGAHIYAYS